MRNVRCSGPLGGRGCMPRVGVCLSGEGVSAQVGVHLPPVDRMTDACENITFPQLLLRTVKKHWWDLGRDETRICSQIGLVHLDLGIAKMVSRSLSGCLLKFCKLCGPSGFFWPPRKLQEGNVVTDVCLSGGVGYPWYQVLSGGRVYGGLYPDVGYTPPPRYPAPGTTKVGGTHPTGILVKYKCTCKQEMYELKYVEEMFEINHTMSTFISQRCLRN